MAWSSGRDDEGRTEAAVEPISYLLTDGRCEPLKAGVHGLLLATVVVCAAYNTAAWFKRRQRHLAINAVVYGLAIWWERRRVLDHLVECIPAEPARVTGPAALTGPAAAQLPEMSEGTERDAA
jgi:hypothetical protein